MKNDILKIIEDKHSGTSGTGVKIYRHITEQDLNKIIAASMKVVMDQIKSDLHTSLNAEDTINNIKESLDCLTDNVTQLETEFHVPKKSQLTKKPK